MIGTVKSDFSRFARTRTLRRCQRSSSTPAKGPMKEYGSSKMANAAATRTASGSRSGENNTNVASADCSSPSPN